MPVHLAGTAFGREFEESSGCLHIGLINNMPDGALKATDRQFLNLIDSAAGGVPVRLSLYALPDVPRTELAQPHVNRFYSSIENLWDTQLDGLIVTGAEPREPRLPEEPYWGSLTRVIDWAEHNTLSAIWSCLAAHAAVLHTDGIERRRLDRKRFGIFECATASEHQLTSGVPALFQVPHSRWNDLPGAELEDGGYRVLTRAKDGSVDSCVKERKSLSVFFQGHPEYEIQTLLLEYRRDVGRYLRGERDAYPALPQGYFDGDTTDALIALEERALSNRSEDLLADFPTGLAERGCSSRWHPFAARIYGNWLAYLATQKERRLNERRHWKHLPKLVVRELDPVRPVE